MQHGIRFEDGHAYDRGMSPWSRLAGQTFLDWLSPLPACVGSTSDAGPAHLPD